MKWFLIFLFIPAFCFGQYRAVRPYNSDTVYPEGLGFRGRHENNTKVRPIPSSFPVFDSDGNGYDTLVIGSQTWFASNLKTTKYRGGASIPNVTDNSAWAALITGAYCWYSNDIGNKDTYGALYNWYSTQGDTLCPSGWHVPTEAEFCTLTTTIDATTDCGLAPDPISSAGVLLGTYFHLQYAGNRISSGTFVGATSLAAILSKSAPASFARYYERSDGIDEIYIKNTNKKSGMAIRCIKD